MVIHYSVVYTENTDVRTAKLYSNGRGKIAGCYCTVKWLLDVKLQQYMSNPTVTVEMDCNSPNE